MQTSRGTWHLQWLTVAVALGTPGVALAHHGMDGRLPATWFEGFASGLAHPVIGLDHLAVVLLVGAFCGAMRQGSGPLLSFVGTSVLGCLLHVARYDLPQAEKVLAASLVLLGVVACVALRPRRGLAIATLAVCGALHGYAYGESIVGAEASPLAAYLLGFSLVQLALGGVLFWLTAATSSEERAQRGFAVVRALGAASAVVGGIGLL